MQITRGNTALNVLICLANGVIDLLGLALSGSAKFQNIDFPVHEQHTQEIRLPLQLLNMVYVCSMSTPTSS